MSGFTCESIARAILGVPAKQIRNELFWRCPWHADEHPSFQINTQKNCFFCGPCGINGNAWQLAARFANVDPENKSAVAVWLRNQGLSGNGNPTTRRISQERVALFPYSPDLRKVRLEPGLEGKPKSFVWEHRAGDSWKRCHGCKHEIPLYGNRIFRERDQLGAVLVFEGEAKADLAGELGYAAFSFKEMQEDHCPQVEGLDVIVWPDRDTSGDTQAKTKSQMMHDSKQPRRIRIITPPAELPEGGDIVDAVRSLGWGKTEINRLISEAKEFVPDTAGACPPGAGEAGESAGENKALAANLALPGMPKAVLDGKLGEIYQSRLSDFPVAYGWLALLGAASALVRPQEHETIHANLYAALVGPVHSGKTSCIERANFLLDVKDPVLQEVKAGSAEGLLAKIGDQQGQGILLFPDELSHLLEKVQITNASFAYILNSLFYKPDEELTIAHGKRVRFHCRLSLIGGIVDDKFDDAFGSATTSGLYDRFLFGQCPSGADYLWRPPEGTPAITEVPGAVPVDRDVWAARDEIAKTEKINPRLLELALRGAAICAAFDGRDRLRAAELGPAWELARYQTRVRTLLQPNCGKNFEAKIALKILGYLNRHAPEGAYLVLRHVLRATHAYEYGPSIVERAINAMRFGGAIEENAATVGKGQKQRLIRLIVEGQ
jgi:hypothetical protein